MGVVGTPAPGPSEAWDAYLQGQARRLSGGLRVSHEALCREIRERLRSRRRDTHRRPEGPAP